MSNGRADRGRWGAVPLELLADPMASSRTLRVYTVLSALQARDRHVQASLGAIAALAHVDERHTRRAIGLLEETGWIGRIDRPGKAAVYEVRLARASPQRGGQNGPGCFSPPGGQISPGRNGPPSLSPSPPLSPEETQEAEEDRPPPPAGRITWAPDAFDRWRLRLAGEIRAAVLDKPKTRAAWQALQARGLSDDEGLAYALAEWSALPEPRRVGHVVQALLDGDHLDAWLAARARRRERRGREQREQLELAGEELAFAPIPDGDWMAAVHARRQPAGGSGG